MSEQSEKQEPTDIQGLEAVELRTVIRPWEWKSNKWSATDVYRAAFCKKIKENRNATAIHYCCKVQAPRNETVSA